MSRSRQPEGPQVRLSSVAWAAAYTWRGQRARLLRALQLLAEGEAVAEVANAVGYESPSALVRACNRSRRSPPRRSF